MMHRRVLGLAYGALLLSGCSPANDATGSTPYSPPSTPVLTPPAPPPEPEPPRPWISEGTIDDATLPTLQVVPAGATFVDPITVLVNHDPGVEVRYTLDGSDPTAPKALTYTHPLELTASAELRVFAENQWGASAASATFVSVDKSFDGFSSNLPLLVLWTTDDAPVNKSETYTGFTLSTFEPPGAGQITLPSSAAFSGRAGLRVRGSSSSGFPKKPYRLELWDPLVDGADDRHPLLGMPSDADWVLTSPLTFDRGFMRNALAYAFSNAIGRYAPRTEFAEVFVIEQGGTLGIEQYVGIYVVTERIERHDDRLDIARLDPKDIAEPDVTGGWLFKEDRPGPNDSGFTAAVDGTGLDFEQPFVYVDPGPDTVVLEQESYLVSLLDELGVAVSTPGFIHPVTGRHYNEIIDVDAWIDHHIINLVTKNPDAFRLSGFLHQDRGGLLVAGPVWDFDRTMNCARDSRASDPTWWDARNQTSDTTEYFDHGFYGGLFDDTAFRAAYFARLDTLLTTSLSQPSLIALVDGFADQLEEAAPRNYEAWIDYPPRDTFADEAQLLRDWLTDRHAWISACLLLPDPMTCVGD